MLHRRPSQTSCTVKDMNDETGAIGDAGNDLARYIREATRNNFRWTESRFLGVPPEPCGTAISDRPSKTLHTTEPFERLAVPAASAATVLPLASCFGSLPSQSWRKGRHGYCRNRTS